jgi:hypothetical protein
LLARRGGDAGGVVAVTSIRPMFTLITGSLGGAGSTRSRRCCR